MIRWLFTLFPMLMLLVSAQHDLTMRPDQVGNNTVEQTIRTIESACIFPPNNLYLRRLAFVESNNGYDDISSPPGYHGGIWRVDENMFLATQTEEALEANRRYITQTERQWGIQWMSATWVDLKKPMYSALGALMYTYLNDPDDEPPWRIEDQADYWVENYRHDGNRDEYVLKASQLYEFCSETLDLILAIEESIGSLNVPHIKSFMIDIINNFVIGPDDTRVGIIKHSQIFDLPATEIVQFLNETTNNEDLINVINFMRIDGGSPAIQYALEDIREIMFQENAGARPLDQFVPRVVIFVGFGESTDPEETMRQAELNHRAAINSYVATILGIQIPSWKELSAVASSPRCRNIILSGIFPDYDFMATSMTGLICDSPLTLTEGCWTVPLDAGQSQCIVELGDEGTTLEITSDITNVAFLESKESFPSVIQSEGSIWIREGSTGYYDIDPLDVDETVDRRQGFKYCSLVAEEDTDLDVCVAVKAINVDSGS